MRWVRVRTERGPRVGVLSTAAGSPVAYLAGNGRSLVQLLADTGGGEALAAAGAELLDHPDAVVPVALSAAENAGSDPAAARLLAPLVPPSIRDCVGHLGHIANCRAQSGGDVPEVWRRTPQFYLGATSSVIGAFDPVPVFPGCGRFDYELELAVVIGTPGRDLDPATAIDHVAGVLLFCDWSARDLQLQVMASGLGPGKGKDGATTFGPWLCGVEELSEYRTERGWSLPMSVSMNGARMGGGDPGTADFSVGEILAYCSRGCELVPGDVIATGTVPTGCLLELERLGADPGGDAQSDRGVFQRWLEIGDVVELDGGPLGQTRSRVIAGAEPIWLDSER